MAAIYSIPAAAPEVRVDAGTHILRTPAMMDICGRPSRSKRNRQAWCSASSGADMCTASDAVHNVPRARMGVCGSDPFQPGALEALVQPGSSAPLTVAPYPPFDLSDSSRGPAGVNPSQAAKSRPRLKLSGGGARLTNAVAVTARRSQGSS
jgi:hypothetical protein